MVNMMKKIFLSLCCLAALVCCGQQKGRAASESLVALENQDYDRSAFTFKSTKGSGGYPPWSSPQKQKGC